jgi:WD40 repeat protein
MIMKRHRMTRLYETEAATILRNRQSHSLTPTTTDGEICMSMPSVPRIDWSSSGKSMLIYTPGDPWGQSRMALFRSTTSCRMASIELHGSLVSAARISADGMQILIGLAVPHPVHGSFWQLDHQSGSILPLIQCASCAGISSVAASFDGRFTAAGTTTGILHVFDLVDGTEMWNVTGHQGPITDLQMSHDGQLIASAGCDGNIGIWSTEVGQQRVVLPSHEQPVSSLDFAPDGWRLVSGNVDGLIRLWDLTTGRQIWQAARDRNSVSSVSISADNHWVASGGQGGRISVWNLETGCHEFELARQPAAVASLKFSPDGHWLASTGYDGGVRLWDLKVELPYPNHRRSRIMM